MIRHLAILLVLLLTLPAFAAAAEVTWSKEIRPLVEARCAGCHGADAPEYAAFNLVNGKPEFMNKDGKAVSAGGTFYIVDGNQVAFDDARFKAGDEVASYRILPLKGDRADINVANRWANGMWTSEVSRKLTTGSKFDVQFSDLNAKYGFGFAAFDNAQVRHAVHYDPLYLSFGK